MKNLSKFIIILSATFIFPIIAFAQFIGPCQPGTTQGTTGCVPISGIGNLIYNIQQIINSIIPILISLGLVYFVWGVVQYVIADGEEAKKTGKNRMIYGVIGFAVIAGLWGLVNIVTTTFDLGGQAPKLETLTGSGSNCTGINSSSKLQDLLCYATSIINNSIIPLIFAIATAMFVWGAVKFFIINADEEAKRAQGRQFMIWGIIALAVMLSVWGLVRILSSTFGVGGTIIPQVCPPGDKSCR